MTDRKSKDQANTPAGDTATEDSSGAIASKKAGDTDTNAIGVDIGTSKIVTAVKKNGHIEYASLRNAFISVENSSFTKRILDQNQIKHHQIGDFEPMQAHRSTYCLWRRRGDFRRYVEFRNPTTDAQRSAESE